MLPSRFVPAGQQNALRKSRLEPNRPSMLPKPRRPGSTDRLSSEARRPSTAGHRSSSAEPARGTFGGGRLSKEASATKLPVNVRSRSQQSERFGQSVVTPLRSSNYSRPTTTPVRTPSEDRYSRSWQTSLERALAFVTVKDQRPISTPAWQRAEAARVGEALAARGAGSGGGAALIRPLTIARFVEITATLLAPITKLDSKLNTDNYVTKLPHLSKRLLYPGTMSKSWLKTVNTLHTFPQALALISYLLDLGNHIDMPVLDEWLYVGKDALACLRRDYLYKCWIRFQEPDHQYEDLNKEYLQNLTLLLGNDEEKIAELKQIIKKYEVCLNDETEIAARADEARRVERQDALLAALRAERAAIHDARERAGALRSQQHDHAEAIKYLDVEIERANARSQQLTQELETQPLTVEQRTKLLEDILYAQRVKDSKRALAEQISKMVLSREKELSQWQQNTLDSCVKYKQGLIHLSAQFPDLASLAIDEKELMSAACAASVSAALDALRERSHALAQRRQEHAREKTVLDRKRLALLDETRAKIVELKTAVDVEQKALDSETSCEALESAGAAAELRELGARLQLLRAQHDHYKQVDSELHFWEQQDQRWRLKLEALHQYIQGQRLEAQRLLENGKQKRAELLMQSLQSWNEQLGPISKK